MSLYHIKPVPKAVFRAYDIRGTVGDDFNEHAFYTIGRAVGAHLLACQKHVTYVARDGRLTSLALVSALAKGLQDSGIDVIDLGEVATPILYFATHTTAINCGLIVTGSHNPAGDNGIKLVIDGQSLVQADTHQLFDRIERREWATGSGTYASHTIVPQYHDRVLSDITLKRPLKIVIDGGNGVAGPTALSVLTRLGCEVIPLFCDIDGRFPNHHPDPTVAENLVTLQEAVLVHQADVGLAFDGDGDRLGIVSNTGTILWPDRIMIYFAQALLKAKPGAIIVYDVKCSAHLGTAIAVSGGNGYMCPTGHSIVKRVMKELDAALAGEMSGHLFFKDRWYGFDDALYSACRFLEIMSESTETIEAQFQKIPQSVSTPEIKIPIDDADKFRVMTRFCEETFFSDAVMRDIDGLRAEFSNGWGLLRASNTTPCLVARFEADDEAALAAIQSRFKQALLLIDSTLRVPF